MFALDRLTKAVIETRVSPFDTYVVIPHFFHIIHTQNPGAAFSLLAESSSEWRSLFLVGVAGAVALFIGSLLWRPARNGLHGNRHTLLGLSLVLGGALGNIYDRLRSGSVTDFLQFIFGSYQFPTFNVADAAITIGAGLLILDLWLGQRARRHTVEQQLKS